MSGVTSTHHQRTPTDTRRRRLLRAAKADLQRLINARKKGWTVTSDELRRARAAIAAFSARSVSRDPSGRVPASRYYSSGSSYPRYKKPARKVLAGLKVAHVRRGAGRQWTVEFEDGMAVSVHEAEPRGRFYSLKVHDHVRYYDEARPEPPQALAHAHQYVALTRLVPHQASFHLVERSDGRSNLMADVHEDLYPSSRDASRRRRRRA